MSIEEIIYKVFRYHVILFVNNKLTEYGINIQSHNKSNERKIMSWKRIKLINIF